MSEAARRSVAEELGIPLDRVVPQVGIACDVAVCASCGGRAPAGETLCESCLWAYDRGYIDESVFGDES